MSNHWVPTLAARGATALFAVLVILWPTSARAQIAPTGTHYAGRPSDTGHAEPTENGGYATSVPLDLPPSRGGLPIPVQIVSGGRGFGAAGVGWDVPLSFVRVDSTVARRRPAFAPGEDISGRERITVSLPGRQVEMLNQGTNAAGPWIGRHAPDVSMRVVDDKYRVFDGNGLTYTFAQADPLFLFAGTGLFLLESITGPGGAFVLLEYTITVARDDRPSFVAPLSIDLAKVSYNRHPSSGCFKHEIRLAYSRNPALQAISFIGQWMLVRQRRLSAVDVMSRATCADAPERLRQYDLNYAIDPDTKQERLASVKLLGRAGTPEASVALPVVDFSYGAATQGSLSYQPDAADSLIETPLPSDQTSIASSDEVDASEFEVPGIPWWNELQVPWISWFEPRPKSYASKSSFIDFTGDGRPDLVYQRNGKLWILRNQPGPAGTSTFAPPAALNDNTFTRPVLDVRSSAFGRFDRDEITQFNLENIWTQTIDVNGDGRLDIIDAAETPYKWIVYLNTPDSSASGIKWVRRAYDVSALYTIFEQRGLSVQTNGYLPLSRRFTGVDYGMWACWKWDFDDDRYRPYPLHGIFPIDDGCDDLGQGTSPPPDTYQPPPATSADREKTYVEWEVKDTNGDGYPDVVFNSGAVGWASELQGAPEDTTWQGLYVLGVERHSVQPLVLPNRVEAVLNVGGLFIASDDQATNPFSAPTTLLADTDCGVARWSTPLGSVRTILDCTLQDVNGDAVTDRVEGTTTYVEDADGDGDLDGVNGQNVYFGNGLGFHSLAPSVPSMILPGFVSTQENNYKQKCTIEFALRYQPQFTTGLRDLTGDGIPDFIAGDHDHGFQVRVGTGAGFAPFIRVGERFEISHTDEDCVGTFSQAHSGIYDVNGDGKPEYVRVAVTPTPGQLGLETHELVGTGVPGSPEAGRLVKIGNGYGAFTAITYTSAKNDTRTRHDVPFPEIVVSSIATTGTQDFSVILTPTHYAYGNIGLFYDSVADAFRPTGYLRRVETTTTSTSAYPQRQVTAKVTDRYALAPVTPLTLRFMTDAQRFGRYLRAGRVSDVAVLAGNFDPDPWALLGVDLADDPRLTAGVHHDVGLEDTRLFSDISPSVDDLCKDITFPYDFELSESTNYGSYDPCSARGFLFTRATLSWRGARPPPSTKNVQTLTSVRSIDDIGRVTSAFYENDAARTDDNVCVDTTYASPTTTDKHVLSAVASKKVWNCPQAGEAVAVYREEAWEYDRLFPGLVADGSVTAHTTYRHAADTGTFLSTVREFDADYDSAANPIKVVKIRDDGATNTTLIDYDAFGIVPLHVAVAGTGVPTLHSYQSVDPLTYEILSATDPNGTIRGATFDGFGRPRLETIDTPEAPLGVLLARDYLGFEGLTKSGRHVVLKEFTDPVAPTEVAIQPARTSTTFLDELGRVRFTEVQLGADYANERLIVGDRTYDGVGRVAFEADAYAASQDRATAYGTTRYFQKDGSLQLAIRGRGPQGWTDRSDPSAEIYPSQFDHFFSNHLEMVTTYGPDALTPGTPQYLVSHEAAATAIGRVISRSTWQGFNRLEHAEFAHDHLGNQTQMIRYHNAADASEPVVWSWRFDSIGQVFRLSEPMSAEQVRTYSSWGELERVTWHGEAGRSIENVYDAFGRITHSEEHTGGITDASTVNEYRYDAGVALAGIQPTNVLGRLAYAVAPTGATAFGYDGFGRVRARGFTDTASVAYRESHGFHGDGSQAWIELALPDNKYRPERLDYEYDSAGRLRWMWFFDGSSTEELYNASQLDAWGRLRAASFGKVTQYTAAFADVGRRLPQNVKVWSGLETREIFFTGFDAVGREVSREERLPSFSGNQTVSYDPIGRLKTSAKTHVGSGQAMGQWSFDYDGLGNILALTDQLGTADAAMSYQATDRDRICRIGYGDGGLSGTACNVDYDSFGNIVQQPTRDGRRNLAYFASGDVRSIENESRSGHTNTSFRYDPFGAVQELDVKDGDVLLQSDRHYGAFVTNRFQSQSTKPSQKAGVQFTERRFPGPGLSVSRRGARGPWIFEFSEPRGTRFTADENGNFLQDLDFAPYGEASSSGVASTDPSYTTQQWNGGEITGGAGLTRLGARFYDPVIGRFLSRDPLLIPRTAGSSNPYSFAFNDPVNGSDPSGLDPCVGNTLCISTSTEPTDPRALLVAATVGAAMAIFASYSDGESPSLASSPATLNAYHGSFNTMQRDLQVRSAVSDFLPADDPVSGFIEGGGEAVYEMGAGLVWLGTHGDQVIDAFDNATSHPGDTALAIGAGIKGTLHDLVSGDARAKGKALVNIAATIGPAAAKLGALAKAKSAGATIAATARAAGGGGANIVYRGLAAGENAAAGLVARAPGAANSVASHVAGARASQWISTTRSLEVATSRFGQHGVVAIDLSKVPGTVVDLAGGIPGLAPNTMLSRWAVKMQEVLVQGRIPAGAITPLP